jgi:hypothetical protein
VTEVSSGRARHGRPTLLGPTRQADRAALRAAAAIAGGLVALAISGWSPGVVGLLAGVLTWLLRDAWHALARRRSR